MQTYYTTPTAAYSMPFTTTYAFPSTTPVYVNSIPSFPSQYISTTSFAPTTTFAPLTTFASPFGFPAGSIPFTGLTQGRPGQKTPAEAFLAAAESEKERAGTHWETRCKQVGVVNWDSESYNAAEPADWRHSTGRDDITAAEVQLAKRCHGFHIETLRAANTPTASHYQLNHYDIPLLDPATHAVKVTGLVDNELSLTQADVRAMPDQMTESVVMMCAGTGRFSQETRFWTHVPWGPDSIGCAKWTGVSLAEVLRRAGVKEGAKQVIFTGCDRGLEGDEVQQFQRCLTIEDAMKGHVLLCHSMNGEDLPAAHGAPLRIIVPGWYGMASVKWLKSIEVTSGGWWGHQMRAYSYKRTAEDAGVPLEQAGCRALMAPPGFPDFFSRTRLVPPGPVRIEGKAWAGPVDIERVEFSSDSGSTWKTAELGPKNGPFGWASWHIDWTPTEGTYVLMCRCFDKKGRQQDDISKTEFNYGAFALTHPQRVYVRVAKSAEDLEPGLKVDCVPEQKAAKASLQAESGLSKEHIEALYHEPGSQ